MRTPSTKPSPARSPANACIPGGSPAAVCDAAPVLVPQGRKSRAKDASRAPSLAAGANDMPDHERAVIEAALAILRARLRLPGAFASGPGEARTLAAMHFAGHEVEVFAAMFLDARLGLIAFEELARGTLTQTSVYPREIVRAALRHNAAGVILAHNHPSGVPDPSAADIDLTAKLKAALSSVDVTTFDHLIVAGDRVTSLAELGLL